MARITVAIVEDNEQLRATVAEVLADAADLRCVGAFANGRTALAELPTLRPDVLIMDVNLPDIGGVECVARLAPQLPNTQILMLTVFQDTDTIFGALEAGAHGYLVKPVLPDRLVEAVREIREGGVPMSRTIARKVIDAFQSPAVPRTKAKAEDIELASREQEVLDLLVRGFTYKEIAGKLTIHPSTVGTYVQRIYEKLHVRNRRQIMDLYLP